MEIWTVVEQHVGEADICNPWIASFEAFDYALSQANHDVQNACTDNEEEVPFHCAIDANNPQWLADHEFLFYHGSDIKTADFYAYWPYGYGNRVCYYITRTRVEKSL